MSCYREHRKEKFIVATAGERLPEKRHEVSQ